jgi:glycosyltransferase involved in cell wall biosynthesis
MSWYDTQYGLPAARFSGIPIVSHLVGMFSRRGFIKTFMPFTDVIIADSNASAENFLRYFKRSPKITVIHNGIDLREFRPYEGRRLQSRSLLEVDDSTFLIGMIGDIKPLKGQEVLLEACKLLKDSPRKFKVIVVGEQKGDDKGYLEILKDCIDRYGFQERVRFTGFIDNIRSVYEALDLVVVPSYTETFGRVIIEAMAMGVPVIASRTGGIPEIILDRMNGVLFETGNPQQLADGIREFLEDDGRLAQRLRVEARRTVEAKFNDEIFISKVEDIYQKVLST